MSEQRNRGFLNQHYGMAAFEWEVSSEEHYPSISARFDITDCNRKVSLEFDCYRGDEGNDAYNCRIDKVDILINELKQFRKALVSNKKIMDKTALEFDKKRSKEDD